MSRRLVTNMADTLLKSPVCRVRWIAPFLYSFSYRRGDVLKIRRFAIFTALAQPIRPVNSLPCPAMKARMFPLMRTFYVAVFYRIVVYIIHMSGKILLVGNQMFPEPPLPHAALTSFRSRRWYRHITSAASEPWFCKPSFYHAPSHREIVVIIRHLPYTMKMIRQQHNTLHFERPRGYNVCNGLMQKRTGKFVTEYLPTVVCHNCKEISPARTKPSSIVRHDSALLTIGAIHRTLQNNWCNSSYHTLSSETIHKS